MNVTVPFLFANHVYVNVNVLFVLVHHTTALLNDTSPFVAIVISLAFSHVVAIHAHESTHVNVIVHVAHAFTYLLLGFHQLHTGFILSTHTLFTSEYHVLQLHFAYRLAGAISHVETSLHAAKFDVEYHPSKLAPVSLGVQSFLISHSSVTITAPVHPFGYTLIAGDVR